MMLDTAPAPAHGTHFRFLDLPGEIRNEIYRHLLVLPVLNIVPRNYLGKTGCIRPYHKPCFDESIAHREFCVDYYEDRMLWPPTAVLQTGMLRANKQVHGEAATVLYGENVFNLVALWHYCAFFSALPPQYARAITRVALEAHGPLAYDIFLPFYHWYGRMDCVAEILDRSADARMTALLSTLRGVHLPALKRLEIQFQYGSTLMTFQQAGTYQVPDRSLEARNCEPWFQRKLADLDRLWTAIDEATTYEDELQQFSAKPPPPLILEVEHSQADSTEVIPGLNSCCAEMRPRFGWEREDPTLDRVQAISIKCCNVSLRTSTAPPRHHGGAAAMKQKLGHLNQALLRLRDERVRQRVDRGGRSLWFEHIGS